MQVQVEPPYYQNIYESTLQVHVEGFIKFQDNLLEDFTLSKRTCPPESTYKMALYRHKWRLQGGHDACFACALILSMFVYAHKPMQAILCAQQFVP